MATIQIPKLGITRSDVPLDSVTHVGPQAELCWVTFGDGQTYTDKNGEAGVLPSRVVQCATAEVFVWGSVEEWDEFVKVAQEKAAEAMAKRAEAAKWDFCE